MDGSPSQHPNLESLAAGIAHKTLVIKATATKGTFYLLTDDVNYKRNNQPEKEKKKTTTRMLKMLKSLNIIKSKSTQQT